MPGFKPAARSAGKGKAKGPTKLHGAGNCGTGKGGFRPGNTCGKDARARLAQTYRNARSASVDHPENARKLRHAARELRHHRRGKEGAIDRDAALKHTANLRAGKYPEPLRMPARAVKADHPATAHPPDPQAIAKFPGVDTSLKKYQAQAKKRLDYNLEHARDATKGTPHSPEKYLDEVGGGFAEMVHSGDHYVRVPSSVLPKILGSERFKTQFETRNSTGGYTKGNGPRRDAEEETFGIPPDIAAERRPIYGYVSGKDFSFSTTHHESSVHQYGDVVVRLRPEIRERSTVTFMDSLGGSVVGVPSNAPSHLGVASFRMGDLHAVATDRSLDGHGKLGKMLEQIDYIEAQHHGGVGVKDIAEVGFARPPSPKVAKALDRLGIPHRVIGDTTSQAAQDESLRLTGIRHGWTKG